MAALGALSVRADGQGSVSRTARLWSELIERQHPIPYLAGSIPWDLMTPIATGLVRTVIRSFAASIDLELALMPPVNVI
jgi:hypothetical protein